MPRTENFIFSAVDDPRIWRVDDMALSNIKDWWRSVPPTQGMNNQTMQAPQSPNIAASQLPVSAATQQSLNDQIQAVREIYLKAKAENDRSIMDVAAKELGRLAQMNQTVYRAEPYPYGEATGVYQPPEPTPEVEMVRVTHPARERLDQSDILITKLNDAVIRVVRIIRRSEKLKLSASLFLDEANTNSVFNTSALKGGEFGKEQLRIATEIVVGLAISATMEEVEVYANKIDELGMFKVQPIIRTLLEKHASGEGVTIADLPPEGTRVPITKPV